MQTIRVFLGSVMMVAVLTGNAVGQDTLTPTETVKGTIVAVMNILNDPVFQQSGMSDARRAALEKVVRSSVSYREMARRALGITWMVLNESERDHFSNLFVQVLRDAVASRMNAYSKTYVLYLSEQREGNFAEVRTLFRGDKDDTAVDVRLMNQSGQWLMYDAVIDGVRLVDNYRSQFVHVMRDAAYLGLVGRLEAMTLLPKSFERSGTP
jgi:phospholipid transport system substrate-binding protein